MSLFRFIIGIVLFPLYLLQANAQYSGGNGDGNIAGISNFYLLVSQDFYCSATIGDGYNSGISSYINFNDQESYCLGGIKDAHAADTSSINLFFSTNVFCRGGNADGFVGELSVYSTLMDQLNFCSGGGGDGSSPDISQYKFFVDQSQYCLGGWDDGFAVELSLPVSIFSQNLYCSGSISDGYESGVSAYASLITQDLYCSGGNKDGFGTDIDSMAYLGLGLWKGISNTSWNTASNWTHDIIPDNSVNVTLPENCLYYPSITSGLGIDTTTGVHHCKSLNIMHNASLGSNKKLHINGKMIVSGTYTATVDLNINHKVFSKGTLKIEAGGIMTIGNQTSGSGTADLKIFEGGILDINGGSLHIDDQLSILTGATFNMSDGELFVHKYGDGSSYAPLQPGNFYISNGVSGGISGGTVRICGRESLNGFHAFTILEADFDFSGTATISFEHGSNPVHYDAGMYLASGVSLQNLNINKTSNRVYLKSDVQLDGNLNVLQGAEIQIESGNTLNLAP